MCTNTEGGHFCSCRPGWVLQANGRDCTRSQECITLRVPPNAKVKCSKSGGMEYCGIQCRDGTYFTSHMAQKAPFRCGPSTNYTWYQLQPFGLLPSCSEKVESPTLRRKSRFLFLADRCRMRRRSKVDFQQDFRKLLSENKRLGCDGQECQISEIEVECGSRRKKFKQLAVRTKRDLVTVQFQIQIKPILEKSTKCDVHCLKANTVHKMRRLLKNLRKTVNKGQLFLQFEGRDYPVARKSLKSSSILELCSSGHVLISGKCVACGKGSYYVNEEKACRACSSGQYQNEEGSLSCKQCAHGITGVGLVGAHDAGQCDTECDPGTYSSTGLKPCTRCRRGTYQPSHGKTSCIECPHRAGTIKIGSSNFCDCLISVKCAAGEFYVENLRECQLCPRNSYQPNEGQNFCYRCPGTTVSDDEGATSSSLCKARHCGGAKGELQGYIESPNWPGFYPSNIECTWNVVPDKGRRILIIIPQIHLAPQHKCADYLVMRKSASPYSLTTFETCESRETPIAFTARSRKLWIQFKTDNSNSATGFSIPYVTYNEEYQDLIEDIVRDGRLYSLHKHQKILQDRRLLDALLEVIAQPYNYFKYANMSSSMFPESFIKLLTPKVRRFFT